MECKDDQNGTIHPENSRLKYLIAELSDTYYFFIFFETLPMVPKKIPLKGRRSAMSQ